MQSCQKNKRKKTETCSSFYCDHKRLILRNAHKGNVQKMQRCIQCLCAFKGSHIAHENKQHILKKKDFNCVYWQERGADMQQTVAGRVATPAGL